MDFPTASTLTILVMEYTIELIQLYFITVCIGYETFFLPSSLSWLCIHRTAVRLCFDNGCDFGCGACASFVPFNGTAAASGDLLDVAMAP
jgi:hypothetical protein